jgi:hypothetical protein
MRWFYVTNVYQKACIPEIVSAILALKNPFVGHVATFR